MNNMYKNCNQEFYCGNAMDEWDIEDLKIKKMSKKSKGILKKKI